MSAREFTKGPWVHCLQSGWRVEWDGAYRNDGWIIGEFEGPDAEANARLAAAAPDLANAVEGLSITARALLRSLESDSPAPLHMIEAGIRDLKRALASADAALAKADGEI